MREVSATTLRPVGAPSAVQHLHEPRLRAVAAATATNDVHGGYFCAMLTETTGNIWMLHGSPTPLSRVTLIFQRFQPGVRHQTLAPQRRTYHMRLHTYLNFGGNCEAAFQFYEQHLGGKITMMLRRRDAPEQTAIPPGWENSIQYASMTLGETELMAADVPERFQPMRSVYLSLTVDTVAEAERIFALLSDGGQVSMPVAETFFAFRFAMLRDRFGTSWMILCPKPQNA
jgi:PhnB protein